MPKTFCLAAVFAALSVLLIADAAAADVHTAYVANSYSNDVTPIDTADDTAGSPITVGNSPDAIAIAPDGATAYVANYSDDTVTPINTADDSPATPIVVGDAPAALAVTPDGTTVYVANSGGTTVTPIDTADNTPGAPITVGTGPAGIAITPDGNTAYVANIGDNTVTPIDTAGNTAGAPIAVGSEPAAIAITPDGETVYVVNFGDNTVTPIDTADNTARPVITVGAIPQAIAITPDGATAYVVNRGGNSVTPIDTADDTAGPPITVGNYPEAIAVTPEGKTAYVANALSNDLTPIHTAYNVTGSTIAVGDHPDGIATVPDQPPIAAFTNDTVSVDHVTSFDASGTSDPDGTVATYHWDYGDGSTAHSDSPTTSHTYAAPGTYTATLTVTDDEGCSTAPVFTGQTASCNGSSIAQITHQVTVSKASPTIASNSSDATIGGAIYDVAGLGSGHNPGGSITLRAFGNTTCSGPPVFDSGAITVSGNNDLVSAHFTPTRAGTYRWTAEYSGDSNNDPESVACNAPHETSSVAKATPTISTSASGGLSGVPLGGSIHDTATLSSGYNPAGTITFDLYGPNDANCSGPSGEQTRPVLGNGSYTSADFTPAKPGRYLWVATYSGGTNNESAADPCNAPHEWVVVTKAAPTLSTRASLANGSRISDRAMLSHGAGPTGRITFRLYGPGDSSCSAAPVFQSKVKVSGNGTYDSAAFSATKPGTYRFTVGYPGDAKNKPAFSSCNSRRESVTVPGG